MQSPLYFMRVLGLTTSTVAAQGRASRRDVNLVLVLDRSGSMQSAGVCGIMTNSAISFVDKFTEGRDRLALITFMRAAHLDYAPTLNFKTQNPTLDTTLGTLQCGGNTGSAHGLNWPTNRLKPLTSRAP